MSIFQSKLYGVGRVSRGKIDWNHYNTQEEALSAFNYNSDKTDMDVYFKRITCTEILAEHLLGLKPHDFNHDKYGN